MVFAIILSVSVLKCHQDVTTETDNNSPKLQERYISKDNIAISHQCHAALDGRHNDSGIPILFYNCALNLNHYRIGQPI